MAVAVQPTMEVPPKKPPTKQRRVVVTGMGVETPLGSDPDVFYNNLLEGVSGISEIEAFDCSQFPTVCFDCDLLSMIQGSHFYLTNTEFNYRELLERSSHFPQMAGLLLNLPKEWISLCFTC